MARRLIYTIVATSAFAILLISAVFLTYPPDWYTNKYQSAYEISTGEQVGPLRKTNWNNKATMRDGTIVEFHSIKNGKGTVWFLSACSGENEGEYDYCEIIVPR
jgi:hypothetical protein